jgi:hypothetical protein
MAPRAEVEVVLCVVELRGFEPLTPSYHANRTADPLHAIDVRVVQLTGRHLT